MKLLCLRLCGCMVILMVAFSVRAQTKGPHYVDNSPRGFVEGFYTWYLPRALNQDTTAGWRETLRLIHPNISAQLAKLLEEDSAAQARCKDLIGLDFDPFLYTQEPAEHYEVGGIVQKSGRFLANVYRVDDGKRAEKPDVVVELNQEYGHWIFVNFDYPGGSDLLTVLKSRPSCTTPRAQTKK